jgi:hypothetical protein
MISWQKKMLATRLNDDWNAGDGKGVGGDRQIASNKTEDNVP